MRRAGNAYASVIRVDWLLTRSAAIPYNICRLPNPPISLAAPVRSPRRPAVRAAVCRAGALAPEGRIGGPIIGAINDDQHHPER